MSFPNPVPSEQEELDQILKDIDEGCCVGEWTETGEPKIYSDGQILFSRSSDGTSCFAVEKHFVDQLLNAGQLKYEDESDSSGKQRRRIYMVT